ncbi:JmjC domain-containing protein [Marinomonas shanghaiensis]|uniref:JmjC domain-containing protein n=1 Tax=Marinomonas shanghaiensis TaxID=2202418 RepID=UPI0018E564F4|nr:cupin domain-containing protein [Marinomonas shanghaiensis]
MFDIYRENFISNHLYKKPFLFKSVMSDIGLSWKDISEIYERADASDPSFKLMNGHEVLKSEYLESYLNVGRVEYRYIKPVIYDYMRKGATLVYNRIRNEPFISNISRQIANFAQAQVITSGYAAFSAKPSYRCHWDTRDVFAVQLKGRKRWILKEPTFELPLYMQQTKDMPDAEEPEKVYLDVVLEEGDILYVPRGWWHNPIPIGEETFHLAVGTFAPTGFDYIRWLVQKAPNIVDGRHNLHGFQESKESLERFGKEFASLMSDEATYEQFMADYIGQHRVDSPISLSTLANGKINQLEVTQKIRLNVNFLYSFSNDFVVVNGNKINLDEISQGLIDYINKHQACTVSDVLFVFSSYPSDKLHELLFQLALNDVLELISGSDSVAIGLEEKNTALNMV